jgi:hypothetical protein
MKGKKSAQTRSAAQATLNPQPSWKLKVSNIFLFLMCVIGVKYSLYATENYLSG